MNHRIRVLGIAPYEGMKTLMSSVVADYPQIDLTLFVGDMEQGLEIARSNFHGDYDVVISRGGTAKMLQKNLALPVIEIDISMYDILCALKLADGLTGKTAMVSFANITSSAHLLCDLMKYNMDIYTIDSAEAVEPTLRQLQKNDYQSILCDMISNTTAKRLGLNSFLITSGVDSIRKAFDQALLLCRSQQRLRDENQFFRQLIQGQIGQTMVFDQDGNLFLSTLDDPKPELLELLRRDYKVTVGRTGDKAIDFVCDKNGEKLYVQVTYLLASDETIQREFGAYDNIRDNYPKYVVSLDEFDMSRNGIKHRNIRDFLLAEEWN